MISSDKNDALFLQKITEKCNKAIETCSPYFTDFLDGRSKAAALEVAKGYSGQIMCISFGGFENAERVQLGFFSKDVYGYIDDEKELYEMFDISGVEIKGSGFFDFEHRDVMGSVLALGIKREVMGDVYLPDKQSAYICMTSTCAKYVCESLDKVARDKVKVNLINADKLPKQDKKFAIISGTVASDRLDCIVSLCTGTSREKAKMMIGAGNVNVNHFEQLRTDAPVVPEDVISVRGYGRFILVEHGGLTKKGRLKTVVHKMI